jgi:predicted dehydrogenase
LEQITEVRRVQAETRRIYAIHFGEHVDSAATVKAGELVYSGAIGPIIQMTGFGPHRFLGHGYRPDWAFDKQYYGGILNDLACHQIEQFLFFTASDDAEIVFSQTGNINHKQFPNFEDYGDLVLKSDGATGYIRVDWLTAKGLETWGDGRLFLLGTQGHIEIRKNCDLAGRPGTNHLFLVDQQSTRYIDCSEVSLPYATRLIEDILNRTQTAISQERVFVASELSLIAQAKVLQFSS